MCRDIKILAHIFLFQGDIVGLNKEQELAVNCKDNKILCLAGAGTGKTYTMIQRIYQMVQNGIDPKSILVLTFTNAAAFEMQERYLKLVSDKTNIPMFKTFHGFCYHLIVTDPIVRSALGYQNIPEIISDEALDFMILELTLRLGIKLSKRKLMTGQNLSMKDEFQYQTFLKAFHTELHKHNLITYDDLCEGVCKLFKMNNLVIQQYKLQYKHILVDEFQDTDQMQFDFINSFKDSDLFVVGDALQAIYGFRGADSSIIKSLSRDPNWTTIRLYQNYRSDKYICETANKYSTYADESYRVELEPVSDKPGTTVAQTLYSLDDFITKCDTILSRTTGSVAILARTNQETNSIKEKLIEKGITISKEISDDTIDILKSIADDEYAISWLSTKLSMSDCSMLIKARHLNPDYSYDDFESHFGSKQAISDLMAMITDIHKTMAESTDFEQTCISIAHRFGIQTVVPPTCSTYKEFCDYLISIYEPDKAMINDQRHIHVGTIHSSKGLEYDTVILYGVAGNMFKLDDEENKNLLYVGITRAKHNLYMFCSGVLNEI